MTNTIIYTDGASSGNPGPGGYAAVVSREGNVREIGGREEKTTNNRMEMSAALFALKETNAGEEVMIYADSAYLINGITKWVFGWQKNNWQTKDKKEVLNRDLWEQLADLVADRKVKWVQVKGHAGSALNNRVDEIAVAFSKNENPKLFYGKSSEYFVTVAAPTAEELSVEATNSRKGAKAFSYLSMLDGEVRKHATWGECEARVKGKPGAKFRKSLSVEDENEIIKSWKKG